MDFFDEQFLNFWRALNQHEVRYIMVGGLAVNLHGFSRTTEDLDIWLEDELENRKRFRKAFAALDYGDYPSLETMQFVPGWTDFYLGYGVRLDLMTSMKGLENITFDYAYKRASIAEIENIKIPFLHIGQLLENKKAVNRPKDQIDVIELEKIRKIIEDQKKKDDS